MLRRWKKAVLVMCFTWDWKERVGSRMTPRLRILAEGVIVESSMFREKLPRTNDYYFGFVAVEF